MMNYWLLFIVLTAIPLAIDCVVTEESRSAAALANSGFGLDLLKHVHSSGKNIIFSPLSINAAIAMTSLGAAGDTLSEINTAFHYSDVKQTSTNEKILHEFFKELILHYEEDHDYSISLANRLFAKNDFQILSQFLNDVDTYYKSSVQQVNFTAGQAESVINDWVAQQTNQKIKDLFASGSLSEDAVLVLANAVYFKDNWKDQFYSVGSIFMRFHVSSSEDSIARMMVRTGDYPYYKDEDLNIQVLEMPYTGNMSLVTILPELDKLPDLVSNLTAQKFQELLGNLSSTKVRVRFPKFKFENKYSLKDTLKELGVNKIFSDEAELTGISDQLTKVSKIVHKALVKVNEEGTEAAAATGMEKYLKGLPEYLPIDYPEFLADHPFVFFIVDKSYNNLVLFEGVLYKP